MLRHLLPNRRRHDIVEFFHGGFTYICGLGYELNQLREIFINTSKSGSDAETNAKDAAIVASLALQYGVPVDTIRRALSRNQDGSASGPLGALLDKLSVENPK